MTAKPYKFYREEPEWIIAAELCIYRRADHKAPRWQGRSLIPGQSPVAFSTKKQDKAEATNVARDRHYKLKAQAELGLEARAKPKSWKMVWNEYHIKVLKIKRDSGNLSANRYRGDKGIYENWIAPFWEKKKLAPVTEKVMLEYWHFVRKQNRCGNDYLLGIAKMLKRIIRYAYAKEYLLGVPADIAPKDVEKEDRRRGHYTKDQIEKTIFPHLKSWTKEPGLKKENKNARLIYAHFVLFSVYSGIRIKTALSLKWKDIEFSEMKPLSSDEDRGVLVDTDFHGKSVMFINIRRDSGKNKGSYFQVVPMSYLTRIMTIYKNKMPFTGDDDYVFPNANGTQRKTDSIGKFHRRVIHSLGDDFKKDKFDLELTTYSWRHSYATWMLIHTNTSAERLALNMDTSVQHIKDYYSHALSRDFADQLSGWQNVIEENNLMATS